MSPAHYKFLQDSCYNNSHPLSYMHQLSRLSKKLKQQNPRKYLLHKECSCSNR